MTDQRVIIEMGTGNDQYGQDYTKAAARAIEDAIRHSSLPIIKSLSIAESDMRVSVTIGVQRPEQVDTDQLSTKLPHGKVTVQAVKGGLNVENPEAGTMIVIASAAVEVFLPPQSGWKLKSS